MTQPNPADRPATGPEPRDRTEWRDPEGPPMPPRIVRATGEDAAPARSTPAEALDEWITENVGVFVYQHRMRTALAAFEEWARVVIPMLRNAGDGEAADFGEDRIAQSQEARPADGHLERLRQDIEKIDHPCHDVCVGNLHADCQCAAWIRQEVLSLRSPHNREADQE